MSASVPVSVARKSFAIGLGPSSDGKMAGRAERGAWPRRSSGRLILFALPLRRASEASRGFARAKVPFSGVSSLDLGRLVLGRGGPFRGLPPCA